MTLPRKAFFRFEASPQIGAGHAIRSCVIADTLREEGWVCTIVTSQQTFDFLENLRRFERQDPQNFYDQPESCDLLVIDNYDLGEGYENHFRAYAQKIMVIDDLANRSHDCDILLDQTYNRSVEDYKAFVPDHCHILTGTDYALLRKDFIKLRPQALEKRRQTKDIKCILISLGGSDPKNRTLEAIQMVQESGFKGKLEVVLGFDTAHKDAVLSSLNSTDIPYEIHVNPDMPKLMYEADLAIGAAGSSVWERACLGLPQVLMQTADNQNLIYENLISKKWVFSAKEFVSRGLKEVLSLRDNAAFTEGKGIEKLYRLLD